MKSFFLFFTMFVIGFTGSIIYKKYMVLQQTSRVQTPLPKEKPFSLDTPPTQAIRGTILYMSGDILYQSRSATEPAFFTNKAFVVQGEEYLTQENGKLEILFPSALQITLFPHSHTNLLQLLPTNIVLAQLSGSIRYKKLSTTPIGIRAKNILIQQHTGDIEVNVDDTDPLIVINVFKGSATLAFNSKDNISTVVAVDKNSTYTYDYEKREGELTTNE